MAERKLTVILGGDSRGLEQSLGRSEKAASGFGAKFGGVATKVGVGIAGIGAAATAFAAKSASTFSKVGGEVLKLQRFTGATAEEASRLRFAGKQAGLDVDVLTRSLGLLSKNVVGTKLDKLGLGLKDASGHAKPLNDELLIIADRFQKMPNGAEKTALAMQLFGRSGAAMIPFLNRGAAGIADLEKQSDALGNTLSGADLDAVKDSTKQHRLFSAAMEGLQIQVGRYVLPILTRFTTFMVGVMPTAIRGLRAVMERLAPIFAHVSHVMGSVVAIGLRVAHAFRVLTQPDGAQGFGEIMDNLLGNSGKYVGMFRSIGERILAVAGFIRDHLKPILIGLGVAFAVLVSPIGVAIAAIVMAYQRFEGFRTVVDSVLAWLRDTAAPAVVLFATAVGEQFSALVGWVREHWAAIQEAVSHAINAVRDVISAVLVTVRAIWNIWGDDLLKIAAAVWAQIQNVVKTAVDLVRGTIEFALALINGDWGKAWDALKGLVSTAWEGIKGTIGNAIMAIFGMIGGIGNTVASLASGAFDGLKSAFRAAINWVIDKWNALRFTLPSVSVFGKTLGGGEIGTPHINRLAAGGVIDRPTLAVLGDGQGSMRREIATPEQLMHRIVREEGGGHSVTVDLRGAIVASGIQFEQLVAKALDAALRRNGRIPGTNIVRSTP